MKKSVSGNKSEVATGRSNIYGFLAAIYREELTKDRLHQIKAPEFKDVLAEQGVQLGDDFFKKQEEKLIEDLAIEYTRLFLGPGPHLSPHESIYHERDDGDWGQLWGKDTVLVKKFIETAGLEYKSEFTGMPDHISVELEFMQRATEHEAQAWEENDSNGAFNCLKMEKKFIDEHLSHWIHVFCGKIVAEAELSFYSEIAKLTKDFIELEKKEIDKYISESKRE